MIIVLLFIDAVIIEGVEYTVYIMTKHSRQYDKALTQNITKWQRLSETLS